MSRSVSTNTTEQQESLTPSTGHTLIQELLGDLIYTEHDSHLWYNSHVVDWQSTVEAFPDTIFHVHSDKSVDTTTIMKQEKQII